MSVQSKNLTIRIPEDLREKVAEAAAADDRSLSSFVVRALRLALAMPADRREEMIDIRREMEGERS